MVKPTPAKLHPLLEVYNDKDFTYDTPGGSRDGTMPASFRVARRKVVLGSDDVFDAAVAALKDWQPQKHAGLSVAATLPFGEGTVICQAAPIIGPVHVLAPCRVVYVEETETCFAYGYGTLEGHPEMGEERFAISREAGNCYFELAAYANAGHWLTRIGSPVTWKIQAKALDAYIDAIVKACQIED